MSTSVKYEVVVHLSEPIADKIVEATAIKNSVNTSPFYGTPDPTITVFGNHITAASDAEAGTKTNPPTVTVNTRDG